MKKLAWVLLLPLFLLFAQQGQLLHEYTHDGRPVSSSQFSSSQFSSSQDSSSPYQKKAPAPADHCPLCLAYAHLAGVAKPDLAAPTFLSDLDFHFPSVVAVASADTPVAPPRSRGPPVL